MSTAVLHDLPLPARLAPWPRASRTTLVRCLWLALLLHLWAALWLGSAPEGTAPPGQGVQGRLNVTLRGSSEDGLASPPLVVAPQPGTAPAEAAPRVGGRVRDTELPPDTAPAAARLGPAPQAPPAPAPAPEATPEAVPPAAAAAPRLPALAPLPGTPLAPAEGRLEAGALRALVPAPAAPLVPPAAAAQPRLPAVALPRLNEAVLAPAPVAPALPAPAAQTPAPPQADSPAAPAAVARTPAPAPGAASAGARPPADAGPRLGADVAVPATAASAPRPLNLELGRLRGGELSRLGAPGVLPVLPRPPETDKLAAEIEKTAREDCRKAHAGAGLLAVVPLAVDTLRGKGCKW